MKGYRVLSLFDGIGTGRLVLHNLGIPVEAYYASEIEKEAIKIANYNFPDIIQLGDVTQIDFNNLKGKIDLLIGGSPCQNLSIIGNRKGLQGEQSGLFYKYIEAKNIIQPKYYLLENNYGMAIEALDEMSRLVGSFPILIDSARVSAQRRKRYYWTNIGPARKGLVGNSFCAIPQPEEVNITLKDVLDDYICNTYRVTPYLTKRLKLISNKLGYCPIFFNAYDGCQLNINGKAPVQTTRCGCRTTSASILRLVKAPEIIGEPLLEVKNGLVNLEGTNYPINLEDGFYGITHQSVETSERLQTLPLNYTKYGREGDNITEIPQGSRYFHIGNGWTCKVIEHIFSYLPKERTWD